MEFEHSERTDGGGETRRSAALAVVFAAIAVLAAVDLIADAGEGGGVRHLVVEGGILLAGFVGLVLMLRRFLRLSSQARALGTQAEDLAKQLEATTAEATRWREEARNLIEGLGAAIDRQFVRWALSPAEKEVALLLLKGLSHKEIANVRTITEATARQQAGAVYKKAGLSGRHDLAAFFLEDLLLPQQASPPQ